MTTLVLLRHGQSTWNLENVFTGWTDVPLSETGEAEARESGRIMKEEGLVFDVAHTSLLRRAINTLHLALMEMDQMWIPVVKHWRLNERHYGALQGLNKKQTAEQHGKKPSCKLVRQISKKDFPETILLYFTNPFFLGVAIEQIEVWVGTEIFSSSFGIENSDFFRKSELGIPIHIFHIFQYIILYCQP